MSNCGCLSFTSGRMRLDTDTSVEIAHTPKKSSLKKIKKLFKKTSKNAGKVEDFLKKSPDVTDMLNNITARGTGADIAPEVVSRNGEAELLEKLQRTEARIVMITIQTFLDMYTDQIEKHLQKRDKKNVPVLDDKGSRRPSHCQAEVRCADLELQKQSSNTKINKDLENIPDELSNIHAGAKMFEEENSKLKAELEQKRSVKNKVQLYCAMRSDLMNMIEEELQVLLKTKLATEMPDLKFLHCGNPSEIKTDLPLVVLCITVSRLGTDASSSMQGIGVSPRTALVIFHHKDAHALPYQSSDRVLTGKEYRDIGGIFDMAFLRGKGIYACEMNDTSVDKVVRFITKACEMTVLRPFEQSD